MYKTDGSYCCAIGIPPSLLPRTAPIACDGSITLGLWLNRSIIISYPLCTIPGISRAFQGAIYLSFSSQRSFRTFQREWDMQLSMYWVLQKTCLLYFLLTFALYVSPAQVNLTRRLLHLLSDIPEFRYKIYQEIRLRQDLFLL